MKNKLFLAIIVFCVCNTIAQNRSYRFALTSGVSIQHYNGNLGNSFFQFNTTCFAGNVTTFGVYLNRSLDLNVIGSIGDFGYCQTDADKNRVVSLSQRCPGCTDRLGMGELRSRMYAGSVALKYKFSNGYLLKEDSRFSPYIYAGMGLNRLVDNMKKRCVNAGDHFTITAGAGVRYNINSRFNVGYNVGLGCFMVKKVYYTNAQATDGMDKDADDIKMEKRKDLFLQNSISLGINF
jgi:opacity protein-like surface antigen